MHKSESKLMDWFGKIATAAAVAFGGWVHTSLTRLDREVGTLKYAVFGVASAPAPHTSHLLPAPMRDRSPLLANPLFPLPNSLGGKTKESHDEKPGH